jgi:hypothetical protein
MGNREVTQLTKDRAFQTIQVVAKAVLGGEQAMTYSQLAQRLGMSKVNGQGLSSYLNQAAAMCAEGGWPNVSVLVVSKDSLDRGTPMPSEGSFAEGFYASTGLTKADIPAEQARVRSFDWTVVGPLNLT